MAFAAGAAVTDEREVVERITSLARAYAESQSFVALLAHELRTLLRATEYALGAPGGADVEGAKRSTRSVQRMAESLLALAAGQRETSGDAGAAAKAALDDLRSELTRLEVEVAIDDLPVVRLAPDLLTTVLRNLVTNAVEAGASTIWIGARDDAAIFVSDDGPGVPARDAELIFGSYTSKDCVGGFGLALVRTILRSGGGDIWLEPPSSFVFRA